MTMDIDVQIAVERWREGRLDCFDVCRVIELQWADKHVEDADGDGSNYNAHAPEDIAVFAEAAAACAVEVAKWVGKAAALATLIVPK
jgi:hypothetical protein